MTDRIGEEFMQKTRYRYLGPSDQTLGVPPPPLEVPPEPGSELIDLPSPVTAKTAPTDLRQAIDARVSVRRYAPTPLGLDELSFLLWSTQGVKQVLGPHATMRTVPSAGARHAFETYLLINRVGGLEAGLYRFLALEHKLQVCRLGDDLSSAVTAAAFGQEFVAASAATFLWTAVAYRMTWRYGQRGYRYLHLDAGHVCQNLYLAAEAVGCGVCAIAAFDDDQMNALLALDAREQFTVYLATVGKKA